MDAGKSEKIFDALESFRIGYRPAYEHPAYEIDITRFLAVGTSHHCGNMAINSIARRALSDFVC